MMAANSEQRAMQTLRLMAEDQERLGQAYRVAETVNEQQDLVFEALACVYDFLTSYADAVPGDPPIEKAALVRCVMEAALALEDARCGIGVGTQHALLTITKQKNEAKFNDRHFQRLAIGMLVSIAGTRGVSEIEAARVVSELLGTGITTVKDWTAEAANPDIADRTAMFEQLQAEFFEIEREQACEPVDALAHIVGLYFC